MPVIRYIGKKSHFTGNLLFEILNNLKNYGIGRIVCQNSLKKYPEICYYIIRKVIPLRETIGLGPDELVYGKVWAEEVFRGRKMENLKLLTIETCKEDWYLVPKEDEDKYLKADLTEVVKILPKYTEVPPALALLLKQKNATLKEPKMECVYKDLSPHLTYKIAEDGMKPNYKLKVQIPEEFKVGIKS